MSSFTDFEAGIGRCRKGHTTPASGQGLAWSVFCIRYYKYNTSFFLIIAKNHFTEFSPLSFARAPPPYTPYSTYFFGNGSTTPFEPHTNALYLSEIITISIINAVFY
jgi:hypothetical protein